MAWIESHQELGRHPKTRKLARALDISRPAVVGHLHYLWWWALDFAQDGDLSRYDADELAEAALWDGDPEAFIEALREAGFVDRATSCLHDWDEYAGKLLDQRRANARRQSDFRNRHKQTTEPDHAVTHNADVTSRNGYVTVTSQLRNALPNHTEPNHTEPNHTEPNHTEQYPTVPEVTDNSESSGDTNSVADAGASLDVDDAPTGADDDTIAPTEEPAPEPPTPAKPERATFTQDAPAMRLAIQLREAVLAHNSTALDARKAMTGQGIQAWARKLDTLISDPRRAPPDVEAVIAYATQDGFWQAHVLNPDKLKKHYDTINAQRLKATRQGGGNGNGGYAGHAAHGRRAGANGARDGKPQVGTEEYYAQYERRLSVRHG